MIINKLDKLTPLNLINQNYPVKEKEKIHPPRSFGTATKNQLGKLVPATVQPP